MINHFLLIFLSILLYEFIIYIKLQDIIKSNLKIYLKILKLFRLKHVSDFRKEKLILNYSKSLFIISIKVFSILTLVFIFIFSLKFFSQSYFNLVISFYGIIELSLISIIYHKIRKIINANL